VLVNNAGGDIALRGGKPKPNNGLGVPMEDVRAIFERNLIGTMIVCRAICPNMAKRGRGSVINIASSAAHFGVDDGVAYAVAKAGIVEWTQCLAVELRQAGECGVARTDQDGSLPAHAHHRPKAGGRKRPPRPLRHA
jgi:NAD(P)-dependent dehydrogenase (short-subunit alcohol dehydrogenase family)